MLLCLFLLFLLCESAGAFLSTTQPTTHWLYTTQRVITTTTTVATTEVKLSPLQLVATPDYPVAAGQTVALHCAATTIPDSIMWYWECLDNQSWQVKGTGQDLTLTKPEESGMYRCYAKKDSNLLRVSSYHTVYIVAMHASVGEKLGVAAFAFSFLALIIIVAILIWLGWQRPGSTTISSNAEAKGCPGTEKSTKGGFPHTECDGDVYMNYTSTSEAYTDLDLANVSVDNVYSSLS